MDKYSKQAFKITLALLLSLTGFTAMIGIATANPPTGYDWGKKTRIWHDFWWFMRWRLTAAVSVKYSNANGDYITGYTTQGSGTEVFDSFWYAYGYSCGIDTSELSDKGWVWVQLDNSAHFETDDHTNHIIAYATCKVKNNRRSWGVWYFEQQCGPPTWVVGDHVYI